MASKNFPVAVIGMAVNLPAAQTCDEFWSMMVDGEESVGRFPPNRAIDIQHVLHAFGSSELIDKENPFFTGSFFEDVDKFDPAVFRISKKEALYIEPEQRIFLQTVWKVLEDAGYISQIRGTKTGVYVGNTVSQYKSILTDNHPSIFQGDYSAAHVSYVFDLKGPAIGCSSCSLLSVHLACQGLLSGDCDMAIAGSITLDLLPINAHTDIWKQFQLLGITGFGAKCRPSDQSANETARGEGCGVVILKPLAKAIHDKDHIYGILEASAANQDGRSSGVTASYPEAQTSILLQAWQLANISPDKISYFETHEMGDPIEISGITKAFKKCGQMFNCQSMCKIPLGSVKANVGHLADGAAGIVSLIKALLCYKNSMVPPSIEPNTHVNWAASPVYVNTHPIKLVPKEKDAPIYISISAFGLLGTNVHAVLRSSSPDTTVKRIPHTSEVHFMALAANSKRSLCEHTLKMYHYFASEAIDKSSGNLKNACYTINTGREQLRFQHRAVVYGSDWSVMQQALKSLHCSLEQKNINPCDVVTGYVSIYDEGTEKVVNAGEKGQLVLPFLSGKSIPWDQYYSGGDEVFQRVPQLPTYAFERVRYWPKISDPLNAHYLPLEYGTSLQDQEATSLNQNQREDLIYDTDMIRSRSIDANLRLVLSSSQQRIVTVQLASPESSAYTETVAIRSSFRTNLKPAEVFKAIVRKHAVLALRVIRSDNSYLMHTDERIAYNPEVETVPDLPIAEETLSKSIPAMAILGEALVKFRCLKTKSNDIVLAVHVHHVLADEITLRNLSSDLLKLTNMDGNGPSLPLAEYKRTPLYATSVNDENYFKSEKFTKDEQFWRSYFTNLPPTASFMILPENECMWSNTVPYRAMHRILSMPVHKRNKVWSYCKHIGITPYRYFLACTVIVLHRYLGIDTVTLAIPVTLRTDVNDNMDGMADNMVIFTAKNDIAVAMGEHIKTISENWLTVQSYSQYPLDRVAKMLRNEHGISIDAFCSTRFNYSSKGHLKDEISVLSRHVKMPLSIDITDDVESINLSIEWTPELLNDSILERLASCLMEFYCTAFNHSDKPIQSIDLLPASEKALIQSFESSGHILPPETVVITHFEDHTKSYPDKVAVICENDTLTYAQLNNLASNLAHELLSKVGRIKLKDQAVIILMNKNEYAISSVLGVWKTGGHFLPISMSNQSSLTDILENMTPAAIILNTPQDSVPVFKQIESISNFSFPIISIHDVPKVSSLIQADRNVEDIAYVIRTSGSTGKPKQCSISQKSISIVSNAWKIMYKMDEFEVSVLQWASLSFDVFVGDILRALICAPGKLVICPDIHRLDIKHILHLLSTNKVSMAELTPHFGFQLARSASKEDLESLRLLILGSDVLQKHIYQKIRHLLRKDQRLLNSYGMTEATIDSSYYEEGDMLPATRSGAVPIGRPFPGVTFHILDSKTLQVCPVGTIGELFISGNILAGGDTEIIQLKHTKEKALKTGDAACWLPCGNVDLIGRLNSMVKLRGFRISTAEIENKIVQRVNGVKDACVTVNAEFLCIFIVPGEDVFDAEIDCKSIRNQLRNYLPYYMLPDFVTVLEKIPTTANGKVDYNSLPSLPQLLESRERKSNSSMKSPTTSTLKTLFASSLGLSDFDDVDCNRTFMELGANSLILIQFSAMIARETALDIEITDIFSYPSINALTDFIDTKRHFQMNVQKSNQAEEKEVISVVTNQQ